MKFTLISCTTITNKNLDWVNFKNFFDLIDESRFIEWHTIQTHPNLIYFLYSWSNFKKDKNNIPLMSTNCLPPHTLEVKVRRNKIIIMFMSFAGKGATC
jgi:hypothetical protein